MGLKPSPYNSVRHYYWGEKFAQGNPRDLTNPFGYDQIRSNLPSMEMYDPTKPKLMKWNPAFNAMAGDIVTFVDDVRMTGSSKENATKFIIDLQAECNILDCKMRPEISSTVSGGSRGMDGNHLLCGEGYYIQDRVG